jgi:hypothetical protein
MSDIGNPKDDGSEPMGTPYDKDVVAWAEEQAALLRAGKLSAIDIEHIAEEIEDVGKSELRELGSRVSVLLAHLLKWQYQPERRGKSWKSTIRTQRTEATYLLGEAPSLRRRFDEARWLDLVWTKARNLAESETGIEFDTFPEVCPWPIEQVLKPDFLPD